MSGDNGQGRVRLERDGPIARLLFDRPAAHNAFTWSMWEELDELLAQISAEPDLRVVTLRGVGGKSFVSGSDIAQFREFKNGADGIAYEAKMNRYFERLLAVPVPTVAIIDGWAAGGGLNLAACCDIRVASRRAKFGSPIARTIGNCVSMQTYARVLTGFGEARAKRMMLLAEFIDAEEAHASGFLARVCEPEELNVVAEEVVARLLENAPITLQVSKAAFGRILARDLDPADDLVSMVYGSEDFRRGVEAFVNKTKPEWLGR
jgi:enoyl-CoA hydratase/carnithine racemase